MITRVPGYYWARWADGDGKPFLVEAAGPVSEARGFEWRTCGTDDYYLDEFVEKRMTILAGPLRVPSGTQASLSWNGSELTAELTCGECGHTELRDLCMGDPVECRQCRRLWRPTLTITCELVTDEAEIAKFRRDYYGEGR